MFLTTIWMLVKISLFGRTVILARYPFDIDQTWTSIGLVTPISALNQGAALAIRLSDIPPSDVITQILTAKKRYPKGCIAATLITKNGGTDALVSDSFGATRLDTYVYLHSTYDLPADRQYSRVLIRAQCPLGKVELTWKNYGE